MNIALHAINFFPVLEDQSGQFCSVWWKMLSHSVSSEIIASYIFCKEKLMITDYNILEDGYGIWPLLYMFDLFLKQA